MVVGICLVDVLGICVWCVMYLCRCVWMLVVVMLNERVVLISRWFVGVVFSMLVWVCCVVIFCVMFGGVVLSLKFGCVDMLMCV